MLGAIELARSREVEVGVEVGLEVWVGVVVVVVVVAVDGGGVGWEGDARDSEGLSSLGRDWIFLFVIERYRALAIARRGVEIIVDMGLGVGVGLEVEMGVGRSVRIRHQQLGLGSLFRLTVEMDTG